MKKNIKTAICKVTAVVALASSAYAVPTDALRYSFDGGATWTTIADNAAGDNLGASDGSISVTIVQGGFTLAVTAAGSTKPNVGSAASPILDLGVHGSGSGTGKLIVEFSDIGFGPIPTGSYITSFTANDTAVPVTAYTVIGANSLFSGGNIAAGVPTGPQVITTIGPVLSTLTTLAATAPGQSNPYSITLVQVFDLSAIRDGGGVLSTDQKLSVPDGGNTLMLLGSALSVLGLGVFRSSRKAAVKA
jgi:hypothetical protein